MKPKRRIDFVFLVAYLFVDLVPLWGAVDIIGPQWLYIGLLNLGVLNYLWHDHQQERQAALEDGIRSSISLFYCLYCLLAALSIFFSMNVVEGLVTYSRTIITLTAFFHVLLLLRRSMDIFPLVSQVVSFLLLGQCVAALAGLYNDLPTTGVAYGIINMNAGMGNKNIFAASIISKLPFVFFCIYTEKTRYKFANAAILLIALYTLFIVNARASFIALVIQLLMLLFYEFLQVLRNRKIKSALCRSAFLFIPFLMAILLSNFTIKKIRRSEKTVYGTVTERLKSINFLTEKGTGRRKHIFLSTFEIIGRHPLTGVGHGNWKLASIPYETFHNNDAIVNYHSHNDFLETTAETGIAGGLCYLLVFVTIAAIYLVRNLKEGGSVSLPYVFASIALGGYFVDACLNFPFERTTMQVYFAFWLAVVVSQSKTILFKGRTVSVKAYKFFMAMAMLINICAVFMTYKSFLSMRIQSGTSAYLNENTAGFIPEFPSIPNLTQTTLPVDAVRAEYLLFHDRHEEAMCLLNRSDKANPYIGYTEYVKGMLFLKMQQPDSAFYYAQKAFNLKPLNGAHYRLMIDACVKKNDTAALSQTYRFYTRYRNEPNAQTIYQRALSQLNLK